MKETRQHKVKKVELKNWQTYWVTLDCSCGQSCLIQKSLLKSKSKISANCNGYFITVKL